MKITREEDYAILLVYALLSPGGKNYLPLVKIAQKFHLSEFFLKKVAKKLKRSGLIKSKEGAGGGYILTKSSSTISYGDIIAAISGPVDISPSCPDCGKKNCPQRLIWNDLSNKISDILEKQKLLIADFHIL